MISIDDIQKLAALARMKLTQEEEERLAQDMQGILGYVDQIQAVSASLTTDENPRIRNVMREDTYPHESGIHTEKILAEAPQREGQYLKVKKIL